MTYFDFNSASEQTSFDLIPKGTLVRVRMTVKPGGFDDPSQGWTGGYATRNDNTGSVYLNCEFVVMEGEFARRKMWSLIGLHSPKGPEWANMGRTFVKAVLNSARNVHPGRQQSGGGSERTAHQRLLLISTASSSWARSTGKKTRTARTRASSSQQSRPTTRTMPPQWGSPRSRLLRLQHRLPTPYAQATGRPPGAGRSELGAVRRATMMLRPRQALLVDSTLAALDQYGNTLAVAPTGSGKTIMLSAVAGSMLGA
jgi:hypothetical protein